MPREIELLAEALAEAVESRAWYEERDFQLSVDFGPELEAAIAAIADAPDRWPPDGAAPAAISFGGSPTASFTRSTTSEFASSPSPTRAADRDTGRIGRDRAAARG